MAMVWKTDDTIFMVRCPKCKLENYAPVVVLGICAWCGYKATEEDCNDGYSNEDGDKKEDKK